MKETILGNHLRKVPSIAVGCMRLSEKSKDEMNHFIHSALEQGAYFFDHADIYGGGMSETVFGEAFSGDPSLKREDIFLQSKCGIRQGCYDLSKDHILESVDGILKRLQTDYLDLLLLHRPDALVEPEDVAAAFDVLFESGKVRHFGVSNHISSSFRRWRIRTLPIFRLWVVTSASLSNREICRFPPPTSRIAVPFWIIFLKPFSMAAIDL